MRLHPLDDDSRRAPPHLTTRVSALTSLLAIAGLFSAATAKGATTPSTRQRGKRVSRVIDAAPQAVTSAGAPAGKIDDDDDDNNVRFAADRLTVSLQPRMSAELDRLRQEYGGTKSDVINRAISVLAFLDKHKTDGGGDIALVSKDRESVELVHLI